MLRTTSLDDRKRKLEELKIGGAHISPIWCEGDMVHKLEFSAP